jgi:hypothetical protein
MGAFAGDLLGTIAERLLTLGLSFQLRQARAWQVVDGKVVEVLLAMRGSHLPDDNSEYGGQNRDNCQNEH